MTLESDYVDYDVFLDPDFSPVVFANKLVLSTNSPTDTDIDLVTPTKKLGYDLEEVRQRITQLTSDKHEVLIAEGENMSEIKKSLEPLKPAVENLSSSYAKLQRDIMSPYYQAQHIHGALKRLHTTTGLLRSLSWFLYLLRQITSIMEPIASSSSAPPSLESPRTARQANLYAIPSGRQLLRAAQTITTLRKLLEVEPALRSVQVIRIYESNLLARYESRLTLHCQNIIRFYTPTTSSSIAPSNAGSNDTQPDDYDTLAAHAATSLSILNPESLVTYLARYIQSQSQASIAELSRSLPSLNLSIQAFTNALILATERARFVGRFEESLKHTIPSEILQNVIEEAHATQFSSSSSNASSSSNKVNYNTLVEEYWREYGTAVEIRIREFANNNSNMAKTIRFKSYPSTTDLVDTYITAPFEKNQDPKVKTYKPDTAVIRQLCRSFVVLFR